MACQLPTPSLRRYLNCDGKANRKFIFIGFILYSKSNGVSYEKGGSCHKKKTFLYVIFEIAINFRKKKLHDIRASLCVNSMMKRFKY
jgi:hypothetical protein